MRWRKVDADDGVPEFPRYNKTKLRELTLGVYNLQMARSYTQEHIDVDGKFKISVSDDIPGILSTKIQRDMFRRNSISAGLVSLKVS